MAFHVLGDLFCVGFFRLCLLLNCWSLSILIVSLVSLGPLVLLAPLRLLCSVNFFLLSFLRLLLFLGLQIYFFWLSSFLFFILFCLFISQLLDLGLDDFWIFMLNFRYEFSFSLQDRIFLFPLHLKWLAFFNGSLGLWGLSRNLYLGWSWWVFLFLNFLFRVVL